LANPYCCRRIGERENCSQTIWYFKDLIAATQASRHNLTSGLQGHGIDQVISF
jgi:hypothetical protein